jgi:undecaprenyl-diphosphatase
MSTNLRAADWFGRLEQFELPICLYCNRANNNKLINLSFNFISRFGDGIFWYTLIALTIVVYGEAAWLPALHMLLTSGIAVLIYKALKERLVRERPFITHQAISCNSRTLDRYSFPSGHTMHATSFSILLSFYYPTLIHLVLPFAILVAMSRVILGLHYISDVIVGGLIGAVLATISLDFYIYFV